MSKCLRRLIIEQDVRLRKKTFKTVGEPESLCHRPCIVCPTAAPAVKHIASLEAAANVSDRFRQWNLLRTNGADERVIDVDIDGGRAVQGMGQFVILWLQRPDNNPFTG